MAKKIIQGGRKGIVVKRKLVIIGQVTKVNTSYTLVDSLMTHLPGLRFVLFIQNAIKEAFKKG